MNVVTIGADIDQHWDKLREYIDPALGRNVDGYTSDDLLASIHDQRSFVVVFEEGESFAVVVVSVHPSALHLHTWGGKGLDIVSEGMEHIRDMARGLGLKYITSQTRPGAAKVLTDTGGFKVKDIFLMQEVA